MTTQGHPHAIFRRAVERGNLMVAEMTLRAEITRPSLVDLLELTALIARKDPKRHPRVAARWLARWLERCDDATIDEATFVTAALGALGGPGHDAAYVALLHVAEDASRRRTAVAQ